MKTPKILVSRILLRSLSFGLTFSLLAPGLAPAQQSNILNSALREEILQQIRSGGGMLGGVGGVGGIAGADTPQRPEVSNNKGGDTAAKIEPNRPAPMQADKMDTNTRPLSNFQRFVAEATGKVLPMFGEKALITQDLWNDVSLPVSSDYLVTPGDILVVRTTGGIEIDYINSVDRNGNISLPKVGTFNVAGVKARDLEGVIRGKVSKFFKNFELSVSLEQTGAVNVFVAGQALNPGMKQIAGSNTLASAALSVAQPGPNGSFRGFELRRGGQTVGTFDLYELLQNAQYGQDVRLQTGDIIYVNQVGTRVALNAESPQAAIFELKEGETLQDILAISGIDQTLLKQDVVIIEGVNPQNANAPRVSEKLSWGRAMGSTLKDGDVVTLFEAKQAFSNAVTLKGNVAYPSRYPYFEGMRVSDLIPNNDALIPPSYYEQRNALARNQNEARKQAKLRANQNSALAVLNAGQTKAESPMDEGATEQTEAGKSLMQANAAGNAQPTVEETVKNLIPQVNWEYAVVERLNKGSLQPELYPFNLRKALAKDQTENLVLQPGDVVTIFSADDAAIPKSRKTTLVKVSGEVASPGFYQVTPGETLRDVLVRAGGLTNDAYLYGTKLMRKSIQAQQKEQLMRALDQAERQLQAAETADATSALNAGDAGTARSVAASQRAYLDKLRNITPDGRIVMDVDSNANSIAYLPPITLEDGDSVFIPPTPGQITVFGSVYSQGAFAYRQGLSVYDYLDKAGGAAKSSDEGAVFVIRANGKVDSAQQGWIPFVSGLVGANALPGDTIYVPEDYERISFMKGLLDVSTVIYQLGLGVAAFDTLR